MCTTRSGQAAGSAGNIRTTPPQLWHTMSCMDCAADRGVSMTGPLSLYIVFGRMNSCSNCCRNMYESSPRSICAEIEAAPV